MKLISLEKFRSENESSILNLKKASEICGGYEPADSTTIVEKESTGGAGGNTDCRDRYYNDAGGLTLDTGGYF